MNTGKSLQTDEEIQAEFIEFQSLINAKKDGAELLEAFQLFMSAFLLLKADNNADKEKMAKDFSDLWQKTEKKLASLKDGKDGFTPKPGVHYPSREQFSALLESMRPKAPINGVDYLVPTVEEVSQMVVQSMDPSYIFKVLFDAPDDVILAVNQAKNFQINPEQIEGLVLFMETMEKKFANPFFVGNGGGNGSGGAGSTLSSEIPSGSVDDSNLIFAPTKTPVYIVISGAQYAAGEGMYASFTGGNIILSSPIGTGGFIRSYFNS